MRPPSEIEEIRRLLRRAVAEPGTATVASLNAQLSTLLAFEALYAEYLALAKTLDGVKTIVGTLAKYPGADPWMSRHVRQLDDALKCPPELPPTDKDVKLCQLCPGGISLPGCDHGGGW